MDEAFRRKLSPISIWTDPAELGQIGRLNAMSIHRRKNFGNGGLALLLGMTFGLCEKYTGASKQFSKALLG